MRPMTLSRIPSQEGTAPDRLVDGELPSRVAGGRTLLVLFAAVTAAAAVAIGAMGAHAFRDAGDLRGAGLLETAGQYLMWHVLAALALDRLDGRFRPAIVVLLGSSIVFAVTLLALAMGAPGWIGAITPVGGTGLIVGWLIAAWTAFQVHRSR